MKQEEIIKRVDKAIEELIAIKVALASTIQKEAFPEGEPKNKVDYNREQALKVLDYLSKKRIKFKLSKQKLKPTSQRINLIKSRLKESCYDEAIWVIDTRFMVWGNDDKFKQYLVVETIFRASKYHKYFDEADNIAKSMPKEFTAVSASTVNGSWTD